MQKIKNIVIICLILTCLGMAEALYLNYINKPKVEITKAIPHPDASQPLAIKQIEAPRVISVVPEYTTKQQLKKICGATVGTQMVKNENRGFVTGMAIGGVAGGGTGAVVGQQIAGSAGAYAGGAIGLIVGGISGAFIQHTNSPSEVEKPNTTVSCNNVYVQKQVVTGYNVTYSYNGEEGVIFLKHRPNGTRLPLSVINA